MEDCIFCKIVRKDAPATIVFENDLVLAFNSISPVSEIHVLIVPKSHIESFLDVVDYNDMVDVTKAAQEIVQKLKIENGYKLVINGGKYQAVKHLHLHLLGGKLEDEKDVLNNT